MTHPTWADIPDELKELIQDAKSEPEEDDYKPALEHKTDTDVAQYGYYTRWFVSVSKPKWWHWHKWFTVYLHDQLEYKWHKLAKFRLAHAAQDFARDLQFDVVHELQEAAKVAKYVR